MTIQERAQKLIEEKQQIIARINQIDGALIEFEAIIKEAQEEQEETVEDTESNDT